MSASNYIIGGNDEHGQNPPTANKRTPIMPYLERSIYENEFNRPAKIYYFISLLRSGFNVFDVHPEIYDVPISTRVSRANNANITLLVTFAYNAFGSGQSFNSVSGALTFYSERNVFAERSKELSEDVFLPKIPCKLRDLEFQRLQTLEYYSLSEPLLPSQSVDL